MLIKRVPGYRAIVSRGSKLYLAVEWHRLRKDLAQRYGQEWMRTCYTRFFKTPKEWHIFAGGECLPIERMGEGFYRELRNEWQEKTV